MSNELLFIGGFLVFIVLILALDLGLFSKKDHIISLKQAGIMSFIMVMLALGFYFLLILEGQELHGIHNYAKLEQIVKAHQHQITLIPGNFEESLKIYKQNLGIEFLTGYVIEYALSVDNIFVIVLIFSAFAVPEKYYHRVLFWGILGAIVMRFIFIFVGAALITKFSWILYVFGAFLIFTGIRMFFSKEGDDKIDTEKHPVVKFASRFFSIHPRYEGNNFFHKINGKTLLTPLFLVLLIVEFTDLIFAVDSIPAIFAVTKDAYIVFFSNIFAIMGLRSMFFLLINIIHKFHYLKTGLAVLLTFIGIKMLAHDYLKAWGFTTEHSLLIILFILTASVVASLVFPKRKRVHAD
ncbi:TerC/Alx family metal homeostasis membrane protein [Pedobacter boryungensis]|uniref:TerC/Alx family metal homeostasis membrane protein n=1 Tax=Pedobacter boryungensis TaxID=869962 RepID=A0ABX2DF60_9SPHI|nr:TerC/Alx family metal homeostasis membrane protein [Pedobacter boryungensis]NQX32108.1 TerC/Alx family metal homeostasis membrane protein [Pedobacter boryungensis]